MEGCRAGLCDAVSNYGHGGSSELTSGSACVRVLTVRIRLSYRRGWSSWGYDDRWNLDCKRGGACILPHVDDLAQRHAYSTFLSCAGSEEAGGYRGAKTMPACSAPAASGAPQSNGQISTRGRT
jgi:hypothetical protein